MLAPTRPARPPTACASSRRSSSCPFAGHPTLGTCHAWLEAGGGRRAGRASSCRSAAPAWSRSAADGRTGSRSPRRRSCAAGPVEDARSWSASRRCSASNAAEILDAAVGRQRARLGGGCCSAASTRCSRVRPGSVDLDVGVRRPRTRRARRTAFEVRAFFPKDGAHGRGPRDRQPERVARRVAAAARGRARAPYVARQGTALGARRKGRTSRRDADGTIWVGGVHGHVRHRRGRAVVRGNDARIVRRGGRRGRGVAGRLAAHAPRAAAPAGPRSRASRPTSATPTVPSAFRLSDLPARPVAPC